MTDDFAPTLKRRLHDYCRARLEPNFPPRAAEALKDYLFRLVDGGQAPPRVSGSFDWHSIAAACDLAEAMLKTAEPILRPGLLAVIQAAHKQRPRPTPNRGTAKAKPTVRTPTNASPASSISSAPKRRGPRPRPIVEHPEPIEDTFDDPPDFQAAITLQMRRHGDTGTSLHRAIVAADETFDKTTLYAWRRGAKAPHSVAAMAILARVERRYRLPPGYFKAKLAHPARATAGSPINGIGAAERRRIAWHLPDDFDQRSSTEREEILEWVRRVVVSGSTDYRRYQAAAAKTRFALRFPGLTRPERPVRKRIGNKEDIVDDDAADPLLSPGVKIAPVDLQDEMRGLVQFKTSTLTPAGYTRSGVWNEATAAQKIEHLGLLFGALAASPTGAAAGYGVPLKHLAIGHLVFPAVWDWYVQWRERRRGFYTAWEVDMLNVAIALTRDETGWLRQTPSLAQRLRPIEGLVSIEDIEAAKANWAAACDRFQKHAMARSKEIKRVSRVHRDPFEPILVVLEADSPVAEYRKITDEIVRLMPDERRHPFAAAEAVRAFLMLRLALHLGLRQRNLRQLLVCPRGAAPTSERRLAELRRGELRWSDREGGWEVFIPAIAFKNARSSFFGAKPFRLVLPDLAGLYGYLNAYLDRHRQILLRGTSDPGTLFVKSVKLRSRNAAYDQTTFYEAWRWAIQRYGIYNPYTRRGAIAGLLPHGPHNIRDVLATHILKKTGSYEQASYAIQDTPDMVAQHYGRFLPQDKAAIAAQILNKVWDAA